MKVHQMFYLESHLAGRKYHDADLVFDYLRVGQTFRLEREKGNHYDANAVQVIFNKDGDDYLLGYIPRGDNHQLAPILDMGREDLFDCRISSINPYTHPENQIRLTIRIKCKNEETPKNSKRK